MSRGPRKYPARQEFLDAARRAGFTDNLIEITDYTDSYYPRNTYQRKEVECVRVRLQNGPMALFKKDTGALYKAESHRGYKLTKTELLKAVVERSPAAIAKQEAEAKLAQETWQREHQEKVWDNYQHTMEIERIALQFAIKTAMESGIDRETATDAVLSLLDSGAMERIAAAKTARIRAAEGGLPGTHTRRGEWKDGKLVRW